MASDTRPIPTISKTLEDGTLIELVFDHGRGVTQLAVCSPTGETSTEPIVQLASGERLIPYAPTNNLIANECVLLPSEIGVFAGKAALLTDVRTFLHRYVDLSETFEQIAAHYILLSWIYDAFTDLPYLRLRGDFGSGKTRALLTIGSLCYKPFFASGASTVSPIFHILDTFGGTLVLDEADFRFSDQTAQLTKLLNNGNTKGVPILRTMSNRNRELNPQAFKVFGPKIIAMREHFSDLALESRFITEETSGRAVRPDIPIHLPTSFQTETRALRNRLLAWRFHARHAVAVDSERALDTVAPRYRQTSLALLSLVDDPDLRQAMVRPIAAGEDRVLQDRAETMEAYMLRAIEAALSATGAPHATVSDITQRVNATAGEVLSRPMTNKWVGGFIRRRLQLETIRTGGVYVLPRTDERKVAVLAERFGIKDAV